MCPSQYQAQVAAASLRTLAAWGFSLYPGQRGCSGLKTSPYNTPFITNGVYQGDLNVQIDGGAVLQAGVPTGTPVGQCIEAEWYIGYYGPTLTPTGPANEKVPDCIGYAQLQQHALFLLNYCYDPSIAGKDYSAQTWQNYKTRNNYIIGGMSTNSENDYQSPPPTFDFYYPMPLAAAYDATNFPKAGGFTRKRRREITSISCSGSNGQRAYFVVSGVQRSKDYWGIKSLIDSQGNVTYDTDLLPATPQDEKMYSGFVMVYGQPPASSSSSGYPPTGRPLPPQTNGPWYVDTDQTPPDLVVCDPIFTGRYDSNHNPIYLPQVSGDSMGQWIIDDLNAAWEKLVCSAAPLTWHYVTSTMGYTDSTTGAQLTGDVNTLYAYCTMNGHQSNPTVTVSGMGTPPYYGGPSAYAGAGTASVGISYDCCVGDPPGTNCNNEMVFRATEISPAQLRAKVKCPLPCTVSMQLGAFEAWQLPNFTGTVSPGKEGTCETVTPPSTVSWSGTPQPCTSSTSQYEYGSYNGAWLGLFYLDNTQTTYGNTLPSDPNGSDPGGPYGNHDYNEPEYHTTGSAVWDWNAYVDYTSSFQSQQYYPYNQDLRGCPCTASSSSSSTNSSSSSSPPSSSSSS